MADKTVTITDNETGRRADMPVRQGTHGSDVIDIRSLQSDLGYFTYDPGYGTSGSCQSDITFIDGERGILLYRGYPIEQLAEHGSFLEVARLLIHGDLPNKRELEEFDEAITRHTMVNESLRIFFNGFHYDAHPMAMLTGVVGSLSAFYHDAMDITDPESRLLSAHKNDPFRLMGFGHRVYKNYDPRATIIRKTCHELLDELGVGNDPQLELAIRLEEIALADDYFVERKLYPNVDFYSGIIYRALGIPKEFFTVLFAIGRTPGWIAQWMEMLSDPEQRIGRPRQLYTGPARRDYIPLHRRG